MIEEFYFDKLGYKVSSETSLLDKLYNITEEVQELLDDTYYYATKGKKSAIKLIQKYIKEYPHIPHFKNHLGVLYTKLGNQYLADEVNKKSVEKHPEYLFGKLNMASKFFYDEEPEKMKELLGEEMDLKALYPDRTVFHLSEALNFLKISVLYYGSIEDKEKAEFCYETMQEIEEKFEIGDEESSQVFRIIARLRMMYMGKKLEEENANKIVVEVNPEPFVQTEEPPVFNHSEMGMLYENGFEIEKQDLELILSLPRKSLIEDLVKVLFDAVHRYEYFQKDIEEEGFYEEYHSFSVHAFFLLGELEAVEALPDILNFLRRDYDFYDFWYSDWFTEDFWEPFYKICHNQLEELKQFMIEPGVSTHTKSLAYEVAQQVALKEPKRRAEVIQWYRDILNHFLNSKLEDNIIDSDLTAFLTWSIQDIDGIELLPEIEELYKRNYPTESICGDFDEVKSHFEEKQGNENEREVLTIYERYQKLLTGWQEPEDFDDEDEIEPPHKLWENLDAKKKVELPKKVGRNDPCPCGSGKKYKKCCLNKA